LSLFFAPELKTRQNGSFMGLKPFKWDLNYNNMIVDEYIQRVGQNIRQNRGL